MGGSISTSNGTVGTNCYEPFLRIWIRSDHYFTESGAGNSEFLEILEGPKFFLSLIQYSKTIYFLNFSGTGSGSLSCGYRRLNTDSSWQVSLIEILPFVQYFETDVD